MTKNSQWWWRLIGPAAVVAAAGCSVSSFEEPSSNRSALTGERCGMEILPSPQTLSSDEVCNHGRVVYSTRVQREAGQPETFEDVFTVETGGAVCVSVHNGDSPATRVKAGTVTIDGATVAAQSDFGGEWTGTVDEHDLGAGDHSLSVRLASTPGAYVDIEVREAFPELDSSEVVVGSNGALQVYNTATDHPLLTPNGDGHHDDTIFNVDGEPLIELPGKDDGSVAYFLEWELIVYNLDACTLVDTGIEGSTRVNSPTNVKTAWDGTDSTGTLVPAGTYSYAFEVSLVREDGLVYDTVVTPTYGMVVDPAPVEYEEQPTHLGACNPLTDPHGSFCLCPGGGGLGGADPDCYFDRPNHLETFEDPSNADLSFLTTSLGTDGRWKVTADLRDFNAGGLVYQSAPGQGVWDSEAELRQWVSEMTGVPSSAGTSLFNFDYTQLGTSTAVEDLGIGFSFNHFFLDSITDSEGKITIDGTTIDLAALWHDDSTAGAPYGVTNPRSGDECTESGNTIYDASLRAKFCAYNEGIALSNSLGFYAVRTAAFDIAIDGVGSTRDEYCITNGVFACGVRTFKTRADITIESQYFVDDGGATVLAFDDVKSASGVSALSVAIDRGGLEPVDGVCSRAVVENDGLRVRLDSADGAVSDSCITNGVFF